MGRRLKVGHWYTEAKGDGWEVEVRQWPGKCTRLVKIGGEVVDTQEYAGCSLRDRGEGVYIGGPRAPRRLPKGWVPPQLSAAPKKGPKK